jgi:hypothetical protein
MKKINREATKIIIGLLLQLGDQPEIDIWVPLHNTLRMQKKEPIGTTEGDGYLLAVGTILPGHEGKFDYCMHFIVVDQRKATGIKLDVLVFPVSTVDERNNVEEHAVRMEGGMIKAVSLHYQRGMANQAYHWLLELKTAGYLKMSRKKS